MALFAAAPFRKPQGVIQISSCCVHAALAGVMFWLKVPGCGGGAPGVAGGIVVPDARDAGWVRSIARV